MGTAFSYVNVIYDGPRFSSSFHSGFPLHDSCDKGPPPGGKLARLDSPARSRPYYIHGSVTIGQLARDRVTLHIRRRHVYQYFRQSGFSRFFLGMMVVTYGLMIPNGGVGGAFLAFTRPGVLGRGASEVFFYPLAFSLVDEMRTMTVHDLRCGDF